jgi:hypothetical protein
MHRAIRSRVLFRGERERPRVIAKYTREMSALVRPPCRRVIARIIAVMDRGSGASLFSIARTDGSGERAPLHLGRSPAVPRASFRARARAAWKSRFRARNVRRSERARASGENLLHTCIRARWSAERATPAGCRRGASWQVRYV